MSDRGPTAHLVSRLAEPVPATREALDEAAGHALSFEADELAAAKLERRVFLGTTLGLGGIAGLLALSNYRLSGQLADLAKRPRVETVVVGQDTGSPYRLSEQVGPPAEIEDKYVKQMTHLYALWREEYVRALDVKHFQRITWLSSEEEQYRFKQWWEKAANGPRLDFVNGGEAHITILNDARAEASVPGGKKDHIVLRIERLITRPNADPVRRRWMLTLFYAWDQGAIRSDVEFINPYGFLITRYLRDEVFA